MSSDEPGVDPPRSGPATGAEPTVGSVGGGLGRGTTEAGWRGLRWAESVFDRLHHQWEQVVVRRTLGSVLIVAYLGALVVIEINRQGWLPSPLAELITTSHYGAVALAFTLLLFVEILALVFVLAASVATSVGKQFEILALIFLRKAFLEFKSFGEPIEWAGVSDSILVILADLGGALVIFAAVGLYYRVQPHRPITAGDREQASFVASKKLVALLLLGAFLLLGLHSLWAEITGQVTYGFFEAFYTVLIFSDVLILLISLRYSTSSAVVFRNAGFAASTVIIRLALTAPPYINVLIGIAAVAFALALSLAYRAFGAELVRREATAAPSAPAGGTTAEPATAVGRDRRGRGEAGEEL
jgi:hypothetical protein